MAERLAKRVVRDVVNDLVNQLPAVPVARRAYNYWNDFWNNPRQRNNMQNY